MLYTKLPVEWRPELEKSNLTLEELNAKLVTLHSPTIAFICLLMIVGVAGNIVVLYIYGKHEPSTHRCFILWLGVIDLFSCSCGMPLLLYSMLSPYMFQAEAACKVLRFTHQFLITCSGFIVMCMAFERHKKICYLFSSKMSTGQVTRLCIGSLVLGVISSIPAAIFYGDATVETGVANITGIECFVKDSFSESSLPSIYNIALLLLVMLCIVYLSATYFLIARVLWKHRKFKENHAYSKGTFLEDDIRKRRDRCAMKIRAIDKDTTTDSVTLTDMSTDSTDQTQISSHVSSNGKDCIPKKGAKIPSVSNGIVDWSFTNLVSLDDEADTNTVKVTGDANIITETSLCLSGDTNFITETSLCQSDTVAINNKTALGDYVNDRAVGGVNEFAVDRRTSFLTRDEDKSVVKEKDTSNTEESETDIEKVDLYTGAYATSEAEQICDVINQQNVPNSDPNKCGCTELFKENIACKLAEDDTELNTTDEQSTCNLSKRAVLGNTDKEEELNIGNEMENSESGDASSSVKTVIRENDVDVTNDDANYDAKVEKYEEFTNKSDEKPNDTFTVTSETDMRVQKDAPASLNGQVTDTTELAEQNKREQTAKLTETSNNKLDISTNKTENSEVSIAQNHANVSIAQNVAQVPIAQNLGRTVRMIHEEKEQIEDTEKRLMKRSKRKNSMFNFSIKLGKKNVEKYRFKQIQITKTLAFITFTFIITFIPHLIVMIMITMMPGIMDDASAAEIIVYNFFLRSIVINSMANPVIYGFFDEKFRKECVALAKRTFCFMMPKRNLIR